MDSPENNIHSKSLARLLNAPIQKHFTPNKKSPKNHAKSYKHETKFIKPQQKTTKNSSTSKIYTSSKKRQGMFNKIFWSKKCRKCICFGVKQ